MSYVTSAKQAQIGAHFNNIAPDYDYWKNKNPYYYRTLHRIATTHTQGSARVLDVGCGTGALLAHVAPVEGLGIDLSPEMVQAAKRANPRYAFQTADIGSFTSEKKFDAVLFFDVIEHLDDVGAALSSIRDLLAPEGKLILSMANPLWEPILMAAERRGLKMPEGPHYRMPASELIPLARKCGLHVVKREWYLLFPKYIPLFSWVINNLIGKLPLIKRLAVIEVFIFMRA